MNQPLPASVKALISALQNLENPSAREVCRLVSEMHISRDRLLPLAHFDHPAEESYGRRLLFLSQRFRIILMSWAPGDFTAIHDHGTTDWGCVLALGRTTHRLYSLEEGILKLKATGDLLPGTAAPLYGKLIHLMGNASTQAVMSLHIYGSCQPTPEISANSRVYCLENNQTFFTNGPAFLNLYPALRLGTQPLPPVDDTVRQDYQRLMHIRQKLQQPRIPVPGQ
jgi:cysteine dioxygenase